MDYCAGDTVGPYLIQRLLGRGSFGVVLLAKDPRLPPQYQQQFALKLVPCDHLDLSAASQAREAALAEAELLRRLRHPHIVLCHEMGWEPQKSLVWLSLDLMDGGDVQSIIDARRKTGQPPPETKFVRQVLAAVGSALDYVHGEGILHRDVKSSNILLTRNPRTIKLADFGISKILEATGNAYTLVGTPYYMSPELVRGQAYGPASDAWSLGCCLYELSALARPFEATNQLALAGKIVEDVPPALPPHTDADIVSVVFGLLEKEPERRMPLSQVLRVSKAIFMLVPPLPLAGGTLPALVSNSVSLAGESMRSGDGSVRHAGSVILPDSPSTASSPLPEVEEIQSSRSAASVIEEQLEVTLAGPVNGKHDALPHPHSEKPAVQTPRLGTLVNPLPVAPPLEEDKRGHGKKKGEPSNKGRRWLTFGRALGPVSGRRKQGPEHPVTLVSAFEDTTSSDGSSGVSDFAKGGAHKAYGTEAGNDARRRVPVFGGGHGKQRPAGVVSEGAGKRGASPLDRQRDNYRHILTPVLHRIE
mmetsp:Transcript_45107/g.107246  ORF Transcript_45107/g.107246 Transcript_45107/m.107246 type:complete len:531 (-) Transcript_45107:88-1680(-)|eukprot:CAMPEP_0178424744 /NCGR_PEP_ID=MMETSP0689_2-20121128/28369_1 /TAXON_ID=160604 /ORGANISM="Amphidinium massartii, Strain CS-259" /LENGTH=530 /DNA_ID=CAMNT_0020046393 /DNA_START=55 /DNA_END=1647 /DNA_ORIENTATION=+